MGWSLPQLWRPKRIAAKTPGELDAMAAAGAVVAEALTAVQAAARPGVSTAELDQLAEEIIRAAGAIPTFQGYQGFPATLCTSVNEQIVHGIPAADVILKEGDLLSVDCGATLDGWVGDSAVSVGIGELAPEVAALNDATAWVLEQGIAAMVVGNRLSDISAALEQATDAAEERFGVELFIVDGYGGHGVGRQMHEEPSLANEGKPGRGPIISEGAVLAIEPMLTLGTEDNEVLDDDWTVVTTDGSWAAHWEHTVAATADGPRILTRKHN